VIVYRIAKKRYIHHLSGTGARLYGGKLNHKGISMIYTSETRSLATVEYLVHVNLAIVPSGLSISTIKIPDRITPKQILTSELPTNWREFSAPSELAEIGTNWALANETLLLRVSSTVVEHEFNILINPSHPGFKYIKIIDTEDCTFDERLLR